MIFLIFKIKNSTELFPTKLRSTALGVQFVAGRLGAIMGELKLYKYKIFLNYLLILNIKGNILFGLAIDLNCYIPLLTISSLMIVSGILSFKLPESNKMDIN